MSVLQALFYLLKPPILSDDHVDDTWMSNFMSCVMQDVTIVLWQTPDASWHRFPLHHPLGHCLPRAPEWMVYTVLRHCSTPESLIYAQSPSADTVTSLFWLQCWLQLLRKDLIVTETLLWTWYWRQDVDGKLSDTRYGSFSSSVWDATARLQAIQSGNINSFINPILDTRLLNLSCTWRLNYHPWIVKLGWPDSSDNQRDYSLNIALNVISIHFFGPQKIYIRCIKWQFC